MEKWTQWEPVPGLVGRFYIQDLRMSKNGLTLQLCAESNDTKIEIVFSANIEAYRCTNESWCFTIFGELNQKYGGTFYNHWSFFKITNSRYADSLAVTSAGTSRGTKFDHFCIVDNDLVVDVLTLDTPIVKILS